MGTIEGLIEATSAKLTKKGNHMRYGVKIGEEWFNTFRDPKVAKGDSVSLNFTEGEYGKDIQAIKLLSQMPSTSAEQPQQTTRPIGSQDAAVMPLTSGKEPEIRRMSALRSAAEYAKSRPMPLTELIETAKRGEKYIATGE